ncbi:MAG: ImmA/IrrE family metallo-endopeptidase [Solirubrobacterales bacterium]
MPGQQDPSLLEAERRLSPCKSDGELIADIAARLIRDVDAKPPIPLELVASYRDIPDIKVVEMSQAGSLGPGSRSLEMRLRAADSPRRRRFTGFHEVGHTFQPGYREMRLFRCVTPSAARRATSDPESLADAAAAELLLPGAYFEPATLNSDFGIDSVLDLADIYEASREATAYRFGFFWPEPTLVVILEPGLRQEERSDPEAVVKLRVVSALPDPYGAWPFIPPNKSAAEDGALARAWNGELITEKAGLEEFGLESDGNIELTARLFRYQRDGEQRERVMALFRRVGTSRG